MAAADRRSLILPAAGPPLGQFKNITPAAPDETRCAGCSTRSEKPDAEGRPGSYRHQEELTMDTTTEAKPTTTAPAPTHDAAKAWVDEHHPGLWGAVVIHANRNGIPFPLPLTQAQSVTLRLTKALGMLHVRSVGDILAETTPPVTWLWQSYLPLGALCLLAAYAKVGKSTFLYPLLLALSRGVPFLGRSTMPTRSLILSEEPMAVVRERLARFGAKPGEGIEVHSLREHPLPFRPDVFDGIAAKVVRDGIGLYVVDTLAAWWDVTDENDNAAVSRAMRHFQRLTGETGATGLLVHHEGKSGEGASTGRSIRGASALFASVDQALRLARPPGGSGTHRVVQALGRYPETPASVVVALDGNTFQLVTASPTADEAAVLAVLTTTPQDRAAVSKATELPDGRASAALEALVVKGQAVRDGGGVKGDPFTYRLAQGIDDIGAAQESWDDPA